MILQPRKAIVVIIERSYNCTICQKVDIHLRAQGENKQNMYINYIRSKIHEILKHFIYILKYHPTIYFLVSKKVKTTVAANLSKFVHHKS